MKRLKKFDKGGNEWITIDCQKCKSKQGIRRRGSLKVNCYVCDQKIGEFEF